MSTLSDVSQSGIGWVYPPQPQSVINSIDEVTGIISGISQLTQGQDYVDVVFGTAQPNENWVILETAILNMDDSTPLNVWPGVVTSKDISGFRLQLNGVPDTNNYYLSWSIRGAFGYYMTGPSSGGRSVASTDFTVHLPDDTSLTGTVIITPSDGGAGGSFTPSTVSLTAAAPSATFKYTPSTYGVRSITTTNNRGLINPIQIAYTSVVTSYTLAGPSTGTPGVPSTNFTVALPVGGAVAGTVTITPSDGGGGGSFTPATVGLTTAAPSATFTYTPTTVGAKTISVTNNGGLTNPGNLTYTVSVAFEDTFTGGGTVLISAHTADTGQTWARSHSGATIINVSAGSAYGSNAGGDEVYSSYTPPSADQEASITVIKGAITGAPEVGIWLRGTADASNPTGYMGRFVEGTGWQFYRMDSPALTYVQIGVSTAGTLANNDIIRFTVSGTGATVTLTLYKNGVLQYQTTDVAANRITVNGKVGLHLYDPTNGTGNYRVTYMSSP